MRNSLFVFATAVLIAGSIQAEVPAGLGPALALPDTNGGLVVHLGSGDGRLTSDLSANGRMLVLGLESDTALINAGRAYIHSRGLYGVVSIDKFDQKHIPLADNLANAVVVTDVSRFIKNVALFREVVRVLHPGGVLLVGQFASGGKQLTVKDLHAVLEKAGIVGSAIQEKGALYARYVKPFPQTMDHWPQPAHDEGQTRVSSDAMSGPAASLQWVVGPPHVFNGDQISLEDNGVLYCLSANDPRNIALHDSLRGSAFYLSARDAFNGLRLWRHPIAPASRLLLVAGNNLYVIAGDTLGVYNAADGRRSAVIGRIRDPKGAIALFHKPWVIVRDSGLAVYDNTSNRKAWSRTAYAASVLAGGNKVFVQEDSLRCFDVATGRALWQAPYAHLLTGDSARAELKFCKDGIVLLSCVQPWDQSSIHAFSADNGKPLWNHDYRFSIRNKFDRGKVNKNIFLVDSAVWMQHWTTPWDGTGDNQEWVGFDPLTGKELRRFNIARYIVYSCHPEIATENFFVCGRPPYFMAWDDGSVEETRVVNSPCRCGSIIANGLFYSLQKNCVCYSGEMRGVNAFRPFVKIAKALPALEKGPAWNRGSQRGQDRGAGSSWTTYRANAMRTASVACTVATDFSLMWQVKADSQKYTGSLVTEDWPGSMIVSDRLTQATAANGMVFVSSMESHTLTALDATSGAVQWTFIAGGRLDAPPTLFKGLCLLGSYDGWVYALDAASGELVWRFRAAPEDRRITANGQIESSWPVTGGILVEKDLAMCVAGRTTSIDGGLYVYALRPENGTVAWKARNESRAGASARMMTGTFASLSDMLISDGKTVSMTGNWNLDPLTGKNVSGYDHLFSFRGQDRGSYIFLSRTWRYRDRGFAPYYYGDIIGMLALNNTTVFGFRTLPAYDGQRGSPVRKKGEVLAFQKSAPDSVLWSNGLDKSVQIEAIALCGNMLFAAGPRDRYDRAKGGFLWAYSCADGKKIREIALDAAPVSEGLAIADGRLYVSLANGSLLCFGKK